MCKIDANRYCEIVSQNRWYVEKLEDAFKKIRGIVSDLGLGSVDCPLDNTVPQYALKFHELAVVMEAKIKERSKNKRGRRDR